MNLSKISILFGLVHLALFFSYSFWVHLPGYSDGWISLLMIVNIVFQFVSVLIHMFLVFSKSNLKQSCSALFIGLLILILFGSKGNGIDSWRLFKGYEVMYAYQDAGPFCNYSLTLKSNSRFRFSKLCYGVDSDFGNFSFNNDTIFLNFDSDSLNNPERFLQFNKQFKEVRFYKFGQSNQSRAFDIVVLDSLFFR